MGLGAVHAVRRGSDDNSDSRHRTAGWKAMQIITTMSSGWVSNTQHQKVVCTKYYAACLKINGNMVFFFGLIAPQILTLGMALACSTLSPELKQVLWKDLKCELHSRCFHDSHQNIHYKKKKETAFCRKTLLNGWHSDLKELQHIGVYLDWHYSNSLEFFCAQHLFCFSPQAGLIRQVILKEMWTSSANSPAFVRNSPRWQKHLLVYIPAALGQLLSFMAAFKYLVYSILLLLLMRIKVPSD